MDRKQRSEQAVKKNAEDKNEMIDFFQLLNNNGMFVDCVSPFTDTIVEIEKKLKTK